MSDYPTLPETAAGPDGTRPTLATGQPAINSPSTILPQEGQPILRLDAIRKDFGHVRALRSVSLDVNPGDFVTLLGPSGSGKTTLLMVIAGFEVQTEGRIYSRGIEISGVRPERRNFGMVFQNYALFPHMRVRKNVAYPLMARRVPPLERRRRVRAALDLVGMGDMEDRRPSELSGGQQQRVALARALVYGPPVLLLDEPLGALDRSLRERMQVELRRLHETVGSTFVYVTHDQEEALTMSDVIVVMRAGLIEQVGTPQEIHDRPTSMFVARFLGAANILEGTLIASMGERIRMALRSGLEIETPSGRDLAVGSSVGAVIRPERVELRSEAANPHPGETRIEGMLASELFAGNTWRYTVDTSLDVLHCHSSRRSDLRVGERVALVWKNTDAWTVEGGDNA